MKRQGDLDYSSHSKRNRGGYSPELDIYDRYDKYSDNYKHERKGHEADARHGTYGTSSGRRSQSPRNRRHSYADYYGSTGQRETYRSLCVSNLKESLPESYITDVLFQEFEKYGEFNVKFSTYSGEKVAYINFRYVYLVF